MNSSKELLRFYYLILKLHKKKLPKSMQTFGGLISELTRAAGVQAALELRAHLHENISRGVDRLLRADGQVE